jgi:hypothetical protein
MVRPLISIAVLMVGALACGCSEQLETGYEPHRLGVSSAERRAYYASPYTPEAIAAAHENGAAAGPGSGFRPPGR